MINPLSTSSSHPKGPHFDGDRLNFALHAPRATHVELIAYPSLEAYPLKPDGSTWHAAFEAPADPLTYTYRLTFPDGSTQEIIDPFCPFTTSSHQWGQLDYEQKQVRSIAMRPPPFNWKIASRPATPLSESIIYEMHIAGFTNHRSSQANHPGTFEAALEKIPHLKQLGISAVELLPIQEFNESELLELMNSQLTNYWGYSTTHFFALMNRYLTHPNQINEFKAFVRELHHHHIEVILDVVYNHTGPNSPLYHLDPEYYILGEDGSHTHFTGCGNTLSANSPPSIELIIASLRYWVEEFHIDGFRFDLASTLTRDKRGTPLDSPPLIEAITSDPILQRVKLISEPWDPGGLYQVGSFPGDFADWNAFYRDQARQYINGYPCDIEEVKRAYTGSSHLFGSKSPAQSINFITAHDGFSLLDLVSYQEKHNEVNQEDNLDGSDINFSANFGVEGEAKELKPLRVQQVKNFALFLLTSIGTPMIVMGDELGMSHHGNNNPWCQNNQLNWINWSEIESEILSFFTEVITWRKSHPHLKIESFSELDKISWIGQDNERILCAHFTGEKGMEDLCVAFNPTGQEEPLKLPPGEWRCEIATAPYSQGKLAPYSSCLLVGLEVV